MFPVGKPLIHVGHVFFDLCVEPALKNEAD